MYTAAKHECILVTRYGHPMTFWDFPVQTESFLTSYKVQLCPKVGTCYISRSFFVMMNISGNLVISFVTAEVPN